MSASHSTIAATLCAPRHGFRALELWCADLHGAGAALGALEARCPRLSPTDHENAAALAPDRADERLAAHVALRIVIERAAGPQWRRMEFSRAAHGKPYLKGAPVAFSLSHVPGLALIGVAAAGSIGVDMERARGVRTGAARRERIAAAAAVLDRAQALPEGGDARFLQAWVRLEAFAKAQGCGIGRLLTRLGIMGPEGAGLEEIARRAQSACAQHPDLTLRDLPLGADLFAAVAAAPAEDLRQVFRLPETVAGMEALLEQGA